MDPEASSSVPETRAEGSAEETVRQGETEKPIEWIEWRENSDLVDQVDAAGQPTAILTNGEVEETRSHASHVEEPNAPGSEPSPSTVLSPSDPNEGGAYSGSPPESEPLGEGKPTPASDAASKDGKLAQGSTDEGTHREDMKDDDERAN